MLADFSMRLACGLACMVACTSASSVSGAYLRAVMLVVLALVVLAALAAGDTFHAAVPWLIAAAVLAFLGSILAALERRSGARLVGVLLTVLTAVGLVYGATAAGGDRRALLEIAVRLSSSLLLGSMTAAMLLGHSYLVSPSMSIDPLRRLVALVGVSAVLRTLVGAGGWAIGDHGSIQSAALGAPVWVLVAGRWLVGLGGAGLVAWMSWQTVRIRSTQSATGILYVGVILTFFGELAGQALAERLSLVL